MNPRVDKWLDLIDRAGWTAVQAAIGAAAAYAFTDGIGWEEALIAIGAATLAAVAKVMIGQNSGKDDTGSLIGRPVVTPAPVAESTPAVPTPTATTRKK